jgi:hypothetical protein
MKLDVIRPKNGKEIVVLDQQTAVNAGHHEFHVL